LKEYLGICIRSAGILLKPSGREEIRMDTPIQNKHILLWRDRLDRAYKAADLASKLAQAGAQVDVILTRRDSFVIH